MEFHERSDKDLKLQMFGDTFSAMLPREQARTTVVSLICVGCSVVLAVCADDVFPEDVAVRSDGRPTHIEVRQFCIRDRLPQPC